VEQARSIARQTLATVAQGADPAAARVSGKAAPRVVELGKDFLDEQEARLKSSSTSEYRRMWRVYVVGALGPTRVADVSVKQIADLHRRMKATPYATNRVLSLLGAFFSYAERQAVRPKHSNPAHEVKPYREQARERFLTPAEIKRLGSALTKAETEGVPPAPTRRRKRKTGATAKHRVKRVQTTHETQAPLDRSASGEGTERRDHARRRFRQASAPISPPKHLERCTTVTTTVIRKKMAGHRRVMSRL
jgi:hypothetical protein